MKRYSFQILCAVFVLLLSACHAEVQEKTCTATFNIVGEQKGDGGEWLQESALTFQYRLLMSDTESTESGWVSFDYPTVKIKNQKFGTYVFSARAVKNSTVYYSGKMTVTLTEKGSNSFTLVLEKNKAVSAKGMLVINESGEYGGLDVEITYNGTENASYSGPGSFLYSRNLDDGNYIVSLVYKKGDTVVGGRSFCVYVPAFSTVNVDITTAVNKIKRNVLVQFYNLQAPHQKNKVVCGYTKDGVEVDFPKTFEVSSDGIPTYQELGLTPIYMDISDAILTCEHIELWTEDFPKDKYFMGKTLESVQTPKMLVINGNPSMNSFCMMRDLETAVVRNATTLYSTCFFFNSNLKELYLDKTVNSIEYVALEYCNNLKDIYMGRSNLNGMNLDSTFKPEKYTIHFDCEF